MTGVTMRLTDAMLPRVILVRADGLRVRLKDVRWVTGPHGEAHAQATLYGAPAGTVFREYWINQVRTPCHVEALGFGASIMLNMPLRGVGYVLPGTDG